jgi:hypothetical protein
VTSRIFKGDPLAGIRRVWHEDAMTGDVAIETVQDVTAPVERSKAEYAQFDERTPWGKGFMHKVASIPLALYWQLRRHGIYEEHDPFRRKFRKWLNDSDNRAFRTRPGRI